MASLITEYNELQFTPKSWKFISSIENFPFNKLPEIGSGSRGVWTMKDVKEILPKPEKKNSFGIFASKAAKELFEKSGLTEDILKNPSGTKGGFTVKDVKEILPKEEKKNSLGIFASKAAKELFEKSGLSQEDLKDPSGTKGGYTTNDIKKLLPKEEKKKKFFASKVAKELFEKSGDLENIEKILKENKSTNKKGLYTKAEVEKAILINEIKKEKD